MIEPSTSARSTRATRAKTLLHAGLVLCALAGSASGGGGGAPPRASLEALRDIQLSRVCITDAVSVSTSMEDTRLLPLTLSEAMYALESEHRETVSFSNSSKTCDVLPIPVLEYGREAGEIVYELRLQVVRDYWQPHRAVIWDRFVEGRTREIATLYNLEAALERLYLEFLRDWKLTHPCAAEFCREEGNADDSG